MRAHLGHAVRDASEQRDQRAWRDRLGLGPASAVVAVERTAELNAGCEVTERHVELPGELEKDRLERFASMEMVVRIEVGRIPADESPELLELPPDVSGRVRVPVCAGPTAEPAEPAPLNRQVRVEPKRQFRPASTVTGGFDRGCTLDHEARARDDAAFVRFDDAAVDAPARSEVVGIDNDPLHRQLQPFLKRLPPSPIV